MPVTSFPWPPQLPRHAAYRVTADGEDVEVLDAGCGAFVMLEGTEAVSLELTAARRAAPLGEVCVKPLSKQVAVEVEDRRIRFTLAEPADVLVEIPGEPDLFVFYGAPLENPPESDGEHATRFKAGQVYNVGDFFVRSGEHIVIEGGAVVCGSIRVVDAETVSVRGRGILMGSPLDGKRNSFVTEHSRDVLLEGLTFLHPTSWTVKPSASERVEIRGIRILAHGNARDGVDLNGCRRTRVSGCFIRSDDDTVAVKSVHYHDLGGPPRMDFCQNVEDIVVENCTLYSLGGGSALELGHEFRCDSVRGVVWRNLDVLAVHQYGSALSIRHCDAALIENVLYEDIRVDHHYHAFLVFRVLKSRFSWDERPEPGRVRNVTLRRVSATLSPFNPGYTISVIGGHDAEHGFEGVHFEDCRYGDRRIRSLDDFDCYAKYAHDLDFS